MFGKLKYVSGAIPGKPVKRKFCSWRCSKAQRIWGHKTIKKFSKSLES